MKLLKVLKQCYENYKDQFFDCKIPFNDSSNVTRFINSKKQKTRDNSGQMTATPDAFIYPKDEPELSLAHIDKLNDRRIWWIGDNRVFRNAHAKTIARADMSVKQLTLASFENFSINRDNLEFWRHVTAKTTMDKYLWATKLSMLAHLVEKK